MSGWLDEQLNPDLLIRQMSLRVRECRLMDTMSRYGTDPALRHYVLGTSTLSAESWSMEADTTEVSSGIRNRVRDWVAKALTKIRGILERGHVAMTALFDKFPKSLDTKVKLRSTESEEDGLNWAEAVLLGLGVLAIVSALFRLRSITPRDVQTAERTIAGKMDKIKQLTQQTLSTESVADTTQKVKDKLHEWSQASLTKLKAMIAQIKTSVATVLPSATHSLSAAAELTNHLVESGQVKFSQVAPSVMRLLAKCMLVLYRVVLRGAKLLLSLARKWDNNPLPVE